MVLLGSCTSQDHIYNFHLVAEFPQFPGPGRPFRPPCLHFPVVLHILLLVSRLPSLHLDVSNLGKSSLLGQEPPSASLKMEQDYSGESLNSRARPGMGCFLRFCLDSDFPSNEDTLLGSRGGGRERDGGPEQLIFLRRVIRVSPSTTF